MKEILKEIGLSLDDALIQIRVEYLFHVLKYAHTINYIQKSTNTSMEIAELEDKSLLEPIIVPSMASAILISMYGDFEFHLNKLCKAYQNELDESLSYKDISGSGITRATTYLEKVAAVKGIKKSKEWSQINDWNTMRNALVHRYGFLQDKEVEAARRLGLCFDKNYLEIGEQKILLTLDNCSAFGACSTEFFHICVSSN